jgi:hypothetical protein
MQLRTCAHAREGCLAISRESLALRQCRLSFLHAFSELLFLVAQLSTALTSAVVPGIVAEGFELVEILVGQQAFFEGERDQAGQFISFSFTYFGVGYRHSSHSQCGRMIRLTCGGGRGVFYPLGNHCNRATLQPLRVG